MNYWIVGTIVLSLISPISYTKSMLAGKAKPHRVTRLIIWLASIAGFLGVLHSTSLPGKIIAGIFLARATYLLSMSTKFGAGGFSRLDITCLCIGILALATYVVTKNGVYTIALGILADLVGFIPTFVKTYHYPESEDATFFAIEGVAALLGVFAVAELRADILFPVYIMLCNIVMLTLIYRKKLFWQSSLNSTET